LELERAYFGPVFGAALFGYMLGATLLTSVSDQIGRKKVIVLGNIFFGTLQLDFADLDGGLGVGVVGDIGKDRLRVRGEGGLKGLRRVD
jgi:MFS family permease